MKSAACLVFALAMFMAGCAQEESDPNLGDRADAKGSDEILAWFMSRPDSIRVSCADGDDAFYCEKLAAEGETLESFTLTELLANELSGAVNEPDDSVRIKLLADRNGELWQLSVVVSLDDGEGGTLGGALIIQLPAPEDPNAASHAATVSFSE